MGTVSKSTVLIITNVQKTPVYAAKFSRSGAKYRELAETYFLVIFRQPTTRLISIGANYRGTTYQAVIYREKIVLRL